MSRTKKQRNGKIDENNQQRHEKNETLISKTQKNISLSGSPNKCK